MTLQNLKPKERKLSWTRHFQWAACSLSWRVACNQPFWIRSIVSTSLQVLRLSDSAALQEIPTLQSKEYKSIFFQLTLTLLILGLSWNFNKPEGQLLSNSICAEHYFWSCEMEWVYVFRQTFFLCKQIICLLIRVFFPLSFKCQEDFYNT